jgi:hypothetical protein
VRSPAGGARLTGATDARAQIPDLLSGAFLGCRWWWSESASSSGRALRLDRARSDALLTARLVELTAAVVGQPLETPERLVVAPAWPTGGRTAGWSTAGRATWCASRSPSKPV